MTQPAHHNATIMLVDDDPEMRAVIRDFLAQAGFPVEEAVDVNELLQLVPRVKPAVIILDHEMPGDWGLEILPTLRQQWPDVPVVIITAFGGAKARETATRLGAVGYLDKPFRLAALLDVVRGALVSREPTRTNS